MTTGHGSGALELRDLGARDDPPLSAAELARGMLLLRASNMNVMRLQLAMERQDRRRALEALDGLVAIDSEIRGLIDEMPAAGPLGEMARRLDDQKAELASEKLVFAAGRAGPALVPRHAAAPAPHTPQTEPARRLNLAPDADDAEGETPWVPGYMIEEERKAPRGRRFALALAALFLLILGAAAGAYLLGIDTLPTTDTLSRLIGDLR